MASWNIEDPVGNMVQEPGYFDHGDLQLHTRRCIKVDCSKRAAWSASMAGALDDVEAGLGVGHIQVKPV